MATVPASAYIGRLKFKKGSTVINHYIAKFLFGTKANGGYYDTGDVANISNATTAAAIRTKICQEFSLDELEAVWQNGYAKGFIGLVIEGGTLAQYHDLTRRRGHKLTKNGVTYIALNDGGLHVRGDGNAVFNCLFDNHVEGYAVLNAPFYDKCTYTFQYSLDNSTWYTYNPINGVQVPAKGSQISQISTLPNISGQGSSTAKLWWRLVAVNDEGTISRALTEDLKPSAQLYQAEVFSSLNSNTYSGSSTSSGGKSLFMYVSDYQAILTACRAYTPPVAEGHAYWTRGDRVAASTAGLGTIRVKPSWVSLYKNTSASFTAGYYLLTKNYGVYLNSTGLVTYIFYAYEAGGLNVTIRLTATFYREYNSETGLYSLTASVVGEYIGGTATDPSTTATIVVSCQFSTYNGGPSAAGAHIYGETSTNYKEDTLTVAPGGGTGMGAFFAGYADVDTIQGVRITVRSNTSSYTAAVVYA